MAEHLHMHTVRVVYSCEWCTVLMRVVYSGSTRIQYNNNNAGYPGTSRDIEILGYPDIILDTPLHRTSPVLLIVADCS